MSDIEDRTALAVVMMKQASRCGEVKAIVSSRGEAQTFVCIAGVNHDKRGKGHDWEEVTKTIPFDSSVIHRRWENLHV